MPEENVSKKQEKHSSGNAALFRKILMLGISFFAGFFIHAYLFPDLLPQTITSSAKKAIGIKEPVTTGVEQKQEESPDVLIKQVTYSDGTFTPSVVRVHYGNYISIRNTSKKTDDLMWLISDSPELTTPRGYAESEQLQKTLLKEGTFSVSNKLRPDAKLTVIVYR